MLVYVKSAGWYHTVFSNFSVREYEGVLDFKSFGSFEAGYMVLKFKILYI